MRPATPAAARLAADHSSAATQPPAATAACDLQPLTACLWPGQVAPVAHGLYVIVLPIAAQRDSARLQVRQALRELLAQVLGRALHTISVDNRRAQAPQIFFDGLPQPLGCSFSYTDHAALVALHLHGTVGVDMMLPCELADWQAVARDYLGPAVTATLAASPPAQRARAFSDAWCALEAELKCHGEALGEWRAARRSAALQAALIIPPLCATLVPLATLAPLDPAAPAAPATSSLPAPARAASAHLVWQTRT